MAIYKANIAFGFTVLLGTAVVGGTLLGGSFDANSVHDGFHALPIARFYVREGHSHGNFMAFFNLFVGLTLPHLAMSPRARRVCSVAAMLAVFLPLGLAAKGFAGAPDDFPPIGVIGILGAAVAVAMLAWAAWRTPAVDSPGA